MPLLLRQNHLPGRPEKEGGGALGREQDQSTRAGLALGQGAGSYLPGGAMERGEGIPACASQCSSHRTSRSTARGETKRKKWGLVRDGGVLKKEIWVTETKGKAEQGGKQGEWSRE